MPHHREANVSNAAIVPGYPWHRQTIEHIKAQLATSRMPHALLYRRRRDYFDTDLGWQIAGLILCDTHSADGNCQHCRLMRDKTHPNVLFLDLINEKVGIDDVRALEQQMWQTSMFDKPKVAYISGMDLLSTGAQNALLKTLEEPPQNTFFILSVNNVSRVLPTIMSRVQRLHHKQVDIHDILHYLQMQLPTDQTEAAIANHLKLADGAPARALELLTSPQAVQEIESEKQQFAQFIAGQVNAYALNCSADKGELSAQLTRYCHYTESMIRFLFEKSLQSADKNDKNSVQYSTWKDVTLRALYRLHDKLANLRRLADSNVNMTLQLTTELTDWQHDRRK